MTSPLDLLTGFFRRRTAFESNADFMAGLGTFIERLEAAGHEAAASGLREGVSRVNGLTDGWASLLQSIDKVAERHGSSLDAALAAELRDFRRAAHHAVYGRRG